MAPLWTLLAVFVAGTVKGTAGLGFPALATPPLAMYFYALGMSKTDFLASTAFTFLIYKLVQIGAVAWYGLFSTALAATSVALTGIALAGFVIGLWIQNRLDQRAFNRAVLALLGALGLWLIVRSVLA